MQLSRTAFITGITGQDGSYLAQLLLSKGYVVHGLVRRSSSTRRSRIDELFRDKQIYGSSLFLHYSDLDDVTTIRRLLVRTSPDELYHLAGQSHVGISFQVPESTCQFTAMGTLKLLEILRDLDKRPRFLHISSSEIFGAPTDFPQNENTPMRPVTPYGVAKTFATNMTRLYRDSFGIYAVNAICYNHESPRRGESFVTRKITRSAAAISLGLETNIEMGSLDARRDWGYAPDYVDAMWQSLQQPEPDDYVIATGVSHSVQDFLSVAFESVGLKWENHYKLDDRFLRPAEVVHLVGDATKAHEKLHWRPSTDFRSLVRLMVQSDLDELKAGVERSSKTQS